MKLTGLQCAVEINKGLVCKLLHELPFSVCKAPIRIYVQFCEIVVCRLFALSFIFLIYQFSFSKQILFLLKDFFFD